MVDSLVSTAMDSKGKSWIGEDIRYNNCPHFQEGKFGVLLSPQNSEQERCGITLKSL